VTRGNVAIITGGASGIGAAIGRELGRRGAHVVLADRQRDLAEDVARSIRARGGSADAFALDVRDADAMRALVDEVVAREGGLRWFFNNAGIAVGGEMSELSADDWNDVLDVNLKGVANGILAAYPVMIRQKSGHIVNTASVAGLVAAPFQGSYTASKHAVVGLSKALRVEAKRHGVKVSVICPGAIKTPILTGGAYGRVRIDVTKEKIEELWARTLPMDVDQFAKKALDRVEKNDAIIVFPRWWRALWYADRISPAITLKLWEVVLKDLLKQIGR
jgi:NAD(P)-dependent dehydrogenase (short-subunit alcohol dehydrogenase family)